MASRGLTAHAWAKDASVAVGVIYSFLHGRTQYQEVLRIPLIVRGPGIPAGTVVPTPEEP